MVDRPAPGALGERRDPNAWRAADLRFERDRGWLGPAAGAGALADRVDGLTVELRPTDAGQVGLFPEHAAMLPWLREQRRRAATRPEPVRLHGPGDARDGRAPARRSRTSTRRAPAVAWARRNAELSGLADRPIRWIVDDALAFVEREARRGRRYDGVVLDPPTYGHGPAAAARGGSRTTCRRCSTRLRARPRAGRRSCC